MKIDGKINESEYTKVEYTQFNQSRLICYVRTGLHYLVLPFLIPFIIMSIISTFCFRTCSEMMSLIPFTIGIIIRESFYKYTLEKFGKNIIIGFGTVILYRDIKIGDNVLIGMFCTIHHCNIGSNVMIAEGVRLLSGSRYHSFERIDMPICRQGGFLRKITISDDVWIGSNAVIMNDIANGAIVGAGSVVINEVEAYSVNVGTPSKKVKSRY